MNRRFKRILPLAILAAFPLATWAQVEKPSDAEFREGLRALPEMVTSVGDAELKAHLASVKVADTPEGKRAVLNAVRVARDVASQPDRKGPFVHYAVPAMSEKQRLPDTYPLDGSVNAPVRIVAAQDEYEPGSFVVYSLRTLGRVEMTLGEFKSEKGDVFPQDKLDLKVVKVWYQNGNGWYSYFGDTELKLVPELLLNDEELIEVDQKSRANFARETGADGSVTRRWISAPLEIDVRYEGPYAPFQTFSPMKAGFADAKTFQPVTLNGGEFKQFFLTAHVTEGIPAGAYNGSVKLAQGGQEIGTIPVVIKVLPFTLPQPKTYFDLNKDYLTASYSYLSLDLIAQENGGDRELARKQFLAILKNQRTHNQMIHWLRGDDLKFEVELLKQAGMMTDPLLASPGVGVAGGVKSGNKFQMRHAALMIKQWFQANVGHHNVFLGYGDEPGATWVMNNRPLFEAYQKEGFKFIIAGGDAVFHKAGYVYDFHNVARFPEDREAPRKWNEVGNAWVAWYATQHIGAENPAFNRRQYGMAPYLAGYSATCNYAHHLGPYNDNSTTYRPMVFAYGTHDGVIDTLQWEGHREGIDDIRYATYLKSLAQRAAKSDDIKVVYAGRQALQFFAELDPGSSDLNATRLEMINHILKLQGMLPTTR